MFNKSDIFSFSIASSLYLGVVGLYLFSSSSLVGEEKKQQSSTPMAVHYKTIQKVVAQKVEPKSVKTLAKTTPKKEVRKIIKAETLTKQAKVTLPKPEPVTKKEIAKVEPITPAKEEIEASEELAQAAPAQTIDQAFQTETIQAEKNLFLSQLREKIDQNKIYPRRARMREIEGEMCVNFTITKEGQVSSIAIEGEQIFKKYTEKAVLDAFPLQVPQKLHNILPMQINLTLKYSLS